MKMKNWVEPGDILFFDYGRQKTQLAPAITEFQQFLRCMGASFPLKFSFVGEKNSFLPNLSLKQNILLDGVGESLGGASENPLEKILKKSQNTSLTELFNLVPDWDKRPTEVDNKTLKLCAIIKAILQSPTYLFFENLEEDLDSSYHFLVANGLRYEAQKNQKIIFLFGPDHIAWRKLINKAIHRNSQSEFVITSLKPAQTDQQNETEKEKVA